MVSIGVSYRGKGTMRIVEPGAKIDAESYLGLVENAYETDMLRIFRPDDEDGHAAYYFHQDNAPAHTARATKAYPAANVPHVLSPWPASSPGLNVLDYCLWGIMGNSAVAKMRGKGPNLARFKVAIQEAYDEVDMKVIKGAIKSWEKRVATCVEQGGGHIEQILGGK